MLSNSFKSFKILGIRNAQNLVLNFARCQSSKSSDLVLVDINNNGIATVTMNNKPVNSLNLAFVSALNDSVDMLIKNNTKGMILTSSSKSSFSAGLDVNELYKPDLKVTREFWKTMQEIYIKLYGSKFPTAALINGHAPAGGCQLAMTCDYRVMLPNFTIGLNEAKLGTSVPFWFEASMRNIISSQDADKALKEGTLFKTNEALKIKLIDEIAPSKTDALAICEAYILKHCSGVALEKHLATKMSIRAKDIQNLVDNQKKDQEDFLAIIKSKDVQNKMRYFLAFLAFKGFLKSPMKIFSGKSKGKNLKNKIIVAN